MMAADLGKFTFTASDSGVTVLWCPVARHYADVETLAQAIEWAENHSEDDS
jgi:hypothetical protein